MLTFLREYMIIYEMKRQLMNTQSSKVKELDQIVKRIDDRVSRLEPAMDDYDAGVIEGLKLAREITRKLSK